LTVRPTVTEQLAGAARVLREVVSPAVADDNAREQLGHVVVALDALAANWSTYAHRVLQDVAELESLLVRLDQGGDAVTPGRPAATPLPDPAAWPTVEELDDRHEALRGRLVEVIARLHAATDDDPAVEAARAAVRAQLLRSAARFA
jgi:hypothetical protein